MDRFWGKITQTGDQLLPPPVNGIIMPKNANDNAIILPFPDTHPSPWSWEINPPSTVLDDYKFPQRWAPIASYPFPIVSANGWNFGKPTLGSPVDILRAIKTNYNVYPNHSRFIWQTAWNFLGGFLNDNSWQLHQDYYFRRPKNVVISAERDFVASVSGQTTLIWGLANATTNQPTIYFKIETTIAEADFELFAYSIFSVWNGNTKLAEVYLTTNYLAVQIDWQNGNVLFSYRTNPSNPFVGLATTVFPSITNQVALFAHEFNGITPYLMPNFSNPSYFNDHIIEPRLIENKTPLVSTNEQVIVRTPVRTVNSNRIVRLHATVPSSLLLVRYRKNNAWHTPIYEGNQTWRVESGASAIPDFQWEVYVEPILESFRETEQEAPEYAITFHPNICLNENNRLNITQTFTAADLLFVRLKQGDEILNEVMVDVFPYNGFVQNLRIGELKLEIYSTTRSEVIYERTWHVYPCNAKPERAGRIIWTIGLVSEYPHNGRAEYTQSDRENKFYKESGMWYTEPD